MNPTNNTSKTCGTHTSSNFVICTGPTLECINLCKGDTVSEVVAKLATELCTIMDTLKVSNYDVSCLTTRTPESFTALIQLIIDSICGDNPNYQPNTNSQQSLPVSQNRAISTTDTSQLVPI